MNLTVTPTSLDAVHPLRELYRRELNCQIVLDSWAGRNWVDGYLCKIDDHPVGYGLVGGVRRDPVDTITEFFLLPQYREYALPLFQQLITISGAKVIEAQTNDNLLTLMLFDTCDHIESNVVLFHDAITTHLTVPDAVFRPITEEDCDLFAEPRESPGNYVLEYQGKIVADGGILFHYNLPYGDIYMDVAQSFRRRGFGSYLIQELKRVCYEMGRVPAARCNVKNTASRATLQKAGMLPCARVLVGRIKKDLATEDPPQD